MTLSDLTQNNYVPYSHHPRCAVIQSTQGSYYPGVRIENSVFPLTISAIQVAIFCCLSEGEEPAILYLDNQSDLLIEFWEKEYKLKVNSLNQWDSNAFARILHTVSNIKKSLKKLLTYARIPHSQFPVSVLLKTADGWVSGVNIENSVWSCGLCAERVAIAKAISYGINEFKSLHICTKYGEYSSPCGACRQVIIEHLPHHSVHLYHNDGTRSTHFSSDLLPYSFQSSSLNKDEF